MDTTSSIHVLMEVWSADLRMGATNDPLDLARYGKPFGLRTTFCGATSPEFARRAQESGATSCRYSSVPFSRRSFPHYTLKVAQALVRLKQVQPDVVHVNYVGWGPSLARAASLLRIPVVARPGPYNARNPWNRWVDAYAAIAPAHAAGLLESPLSDKVRIVGPFVSVERLEVSYVDQPLPDRIHPTNCRFLFLGQLVQRKGLDTLVRAFARLEAREAELLLVGGDWGLGGYPQEIKDLVRDLGVSDRVVTLGYRPDVGGLLRSADVFVLPSLSEGVPRSVLEAMLLGVPVVASRVGGIPSVLTHGETGLLVKPADPGELSQAMSLLASSRTLRARMSEAGRRWAEHHISPSETARNYVDLYRRLQSRRL